VYASTKITKSGLDAAPVPIDVELVGTPSSMETAFVAAKISRRLAVRKEDCRRGIGCGQQRCIDDSRPHG
jgi:hypothetical protein